MQQCVRCGDVCYLRDSFAMRYCHRCNRVGLESVALCRLRLLHCRSACWPVCPVSLFVCFALNLRFLIEIMTVVVWLATSLIEEEHLSWYYMTATIIALRMLELFAVNEATWRRCIATALSLVRCNFLFVSNFFDMKMCFFSRCRRQFRELRVHGINRASLGVPKYVLIAQVQSFVQ